MNGIDLYFETAQNLQQKIIQDQRDLLSQIAREMALTISQEGRIFLFGTGHSHMMMEEGFYRAGGLACVVPIFCSALMLHENAVLSGTLERTPGLAKLLLAPYNPQPGEMIFIYSNSGVNQMPVEMALEARERGLKVVSVCSKAYASAAKLSALGKRLYEVADFALDNGGMAGDALVAVEGTPWKVAPTSTLTNTLMWNCLLTETVFLLQQQAADLPLIASLNMPGAQEHNQRVFDKWKKVNPYL
jgi:uncharacterized phosphosugar-binding protein